MVRLICCPLAGRSGAAARTLLRRTSSSSGAADHGDPGVAERGALGRARNRSGRAGNRESRAARCPARSPDRAGPARRRSWSTGRPRTCSPSARSCSSASSRAAVAASICSSMASICSAGIGDLGGDLQLDLADLDLRLLNLQARPFEGGPVRVLAERVGHPQFHAPERIVGVDDVVDRVPDSRPESCPRRRRRSPRRRCPPARAAGRPGRSTGSCPPGRGWGSVLLRKFSTSTLLTSSCRRTREMSVRRSSAPRIAPSRSIGVGTIWGWSVGLSSASHSSSAVAAHDELLQRELVGPQGPESPAPATAAALPPPTAPARRRSGPACRFSTRARLSRTSCSASSSACCCTATAARAYTSSQYARRTLARVLMTVCSRSMSEMSRLMPDTTSCVRCGSVRKPRSSGCVLLEDHVGAEARVESVEDVRGLEAGGIPRQVVPGPRPTSSVG